MKNRSTKRANAHTPEKATGRVGPFPYHRAGDTPFKDMEDQARYQEQELKKQLTKDRLDNKKLVER